MNQASARNAQPMITTVEDSAIPIATTRWKFTWPQHVPQIFAAGTAAVSLSLAIILGTNRSSGATVSG